jgi:cell division septation protein DedD
MYAGNLSGKKRKRQLVRVVGAVAAVTAGAILLPKLIAHFKNQGMSTEQATDMANKVASGVLPLPKGVKETSPELFQPSGPVETTIFGLTLPTLGVVAAIGIGGYLILRKK